jgi:hypothetical protein
VEQGFGDVMLVLGELKAKIENIEHVVIGNGQPGLQQRMGSLEASKNRLWGAGWLMGILWGVVEYFHKIKP